MASSPVNESNRISLQGVARFNPQGPLRPAQSTSEFSEVLQTMQNDLTSELTGTGGADATGSTSLATALAENMTNSAVSSLMGSAGGDNALSQLLGLNNSSGTSTDSLSTLLSGLTGSGSALSGATNAGGNADVNALLLSLLSQNSATTGLAAGNAQNVTAQLLSLLTQNSTQDNTLATLLSALTKANPVNADGGSIPANAWEQSSAGVKSDVSARSATQYRSVIDQFDVENNTRYAVKNGNTYCNIFLWDVTRAMNAEIPHYTDKDTGEIKTGADDNTLAMTANRTSDWLNTHGARYGWVEATPEQAQAFANGGRPAMTVWKNAAGHGHVQVVCPSADGGYNAEKGVTVAQAGRRLRNYTYITDIYGSNTLPKVQYFVHL